MKRSHALLAVAALCGVAATASAGTAHITGDGMDFSIGGADFGNLFSNPGGTGFSGQELRSIHQSINGAGINTDGVVTFILANTNAGLSFFALVDNNMTVGPKDVDAMLGINTTVQGADGYVNNDANFMNNGGTFADDGSSQTLAGDFFWHPDGGATGMAWTGLDIGDGGTFDFSAYMGEDSETAGTFGGLAASDTFQFVSWNGTSWESVMHGSFDEGGSFSFAFGIVPLPPALALGIAGLGLVAVGRRRRAKKA